MSAARFKSKDDYFGKRSGLAERVLATKSPKPARKRGVESSIPAALLRVHFCKTVDRFEIEGRGRYRKGEYPLDDALRNHLDGDVTVLVNPLSGAGETAFSVARFDLSGGMDLPFSKARQFADELQVYGVPSLVEVAEGGKGHYHVWIFHEEPVPSWPFSEALIRLGQRLFGVCLETVPSVRGDEYIALPLQGESMLLQRRVFVNAVGKMIKDQGHVLQSIEYCPRNTAESFMTAVAQAAHSTKVVPSAQTSASPAKPGTAPACPPVGAAHPGTAVPTERVNPAQVQQRVSETAPVSQVPAESSAQAPAAGNRSVPGSGVLPDTRKSAPAAETIREARTGAAVVPPEEPRSPEPLKNAATVDAPEPGEKRKRGETPPASASSGTGTELAAPLKKGRTSGTQTSREETARLSAGDRASEPMEQPLPGAGSSAETVSDPPRPVQAALPEDGPLQARETTQPAIVNQVSGEPMPEDDPETPPMPVSSLSPEASEPEVAVPEQSAELDILVFSRNGVLFALETGEVDRVQGVGSLILAPVPGGVYGRIDDGGKTITVLDSSVVSGKGGSPAPRRGRVIIMGGARRGYGFLADSVVGTRRISLDRVLPPCGEPRIRGIISGDGARVLLIDAEGMSIMRGADPHRENPENGLREAAGRYVIFTLYERTFCVPADRVREILPSGKSLRTAVTAVPYRGGELRLINFTVETGRSEKASESAVKTASNRGRVLVLEGKTDLAGLSVESVGEIRDIPAESIGAPEGVCTGSWPVAAVARLGNAGSPVLLLDPGGMMESVR